MTSIPPFFSVIFAMASNRVIGRDGKMPWHVPEELALFKRITMGHTVVMGRKTFESIGRPLPGRNNLVLSANRGVANPPGVRFIRNLEEAFERNEDKPDEIFVIGGSQIYALALPLAQKIYGTRFDRNFEGDTFMPEFDDNDFELEFEKNVKAKIDFRFEIRTRRNSPIFGQPSRDVFNN